MESLLVADSFRVRVYGGQAQVRGLRRHLERFSRTVRSAADEIGAPVNELGDFLRDSLREIADFGEGFPRLEFHNTGALTLRTRTVPELRDTLAMRTIDPDAIADADPPPHPSRKGPNIEAYATLNRRLGAEALLLDAGGNLLEGATTSVLWWSGDELSTVSDPRRVPSITEALIRVFAAQRGVILRASRIAPAALADHEVWAVNALHGIRTVSRIDGAALPAPDQDRLDAFRSGLDLTWEPLHDPAAAMADL